MKSFAFAAALVAVCSAVDVESVGYGHAYAPRKPEFRVSVKQSKGGAHSGASKAYGADYQRASASDWDAYGRDQDLSIKESYGRTNAKSYAAESYDEWDNKDDDKWGAQAWGKDRDVYGASSYGKAASAGDYGANNYAGGSAASRFQTKGGKKKQASAQYGHGAKGSVWKGASGAYGAAKGAYDNDAWAKQAYGSDYDSRWGKSYDSVEAKSYSNENYARQVRADDDQWAEDYDRYDSGDADAYGNAASRWSKNGKGGPGRYNGPGGKKAEHDGASAGYGNKYWGKSASDWDAWGRDQDYAEDVSYDKTLAKSYAAESYDEWDNADDDKWGAQAWGKDRDVYGASSYGQAASSADYDKYGSYGGGAASRWAGGNKLGYGKESDAASRQGARGYGSMTWQGASGAQQAAQGSYDNDEWAKQAYGSDYDSRWGKSYDSVSAKSYANESYARKLRADDDQWAEDYDRYDDKDGKGYGAAASSAVRDGDKKLGNAHGSHGYGAYGAVEVKGGSRQGASKAGYGNRMARSASDFDAWGRDQDLSIDESYDQTWAKSYDAESYDEWDNKDDDKWGAQAWGKDRDIYGASSVGQAASEADWDGYGREGAQASSSDGRKTQTVHYAPQGYGHGGHGGYGAYGGHSRQQLVAAHQKAAAAAAGRYAEKDHDHASRGRAAARAGYDNDEWAKQAYGSDYDSRWGKSYDSVNAKSYDNEQYARAIQADDDQWAEDYDRYDDRDATGYGRAASASAKAPVKTTYSVQPVYRGW